MELKKLVQRAGARDLTDPGALFDYFETLRLLEKEDFALAHEKVKQIRKISAEEAKRQISEKMLAINKKNRSF